MSKEFKIPQFHWGDDSPFKRSEERPLRLTIHNRGLEGLSEEEKSALDVIQELGKLSNLKVLQFEPGCFPHIQLKDSNEEGWVDLHIDHEDGGWTKSSLEKQQVFKNAVHIYDENHENYQEYLELEAHRSRNQDIFITSSKGLLSEGTSFSYSNIRKPSEALKIIGLFLRSRDDWTYWYEKGRAISDKKEFYWFLMRSKLPNVRQHLKKGPNLGNLKDSLTTLSRSVLDRCYTLLQIRDELGKQFYGDNDYEVVLYHFNYFSLLVTGILDAQARIAFEIFNIEGNSPRGAGFNESKKPFLSKLEKKAPSLHQLITGKKNNALIELLHCLRNTIHGSGHTAQDKMGFSNGLHIILSIEAGKEEWKYGKILDCTEKEGLFEHKPRQLTVNGFEQGPQVDYLVEPYNFVSYLLEHTFNLVNMIAKETNITEISHNVQSRNNQWMVDRFKMLGD